MITSLEKVKSVLRIKNNNLDEYIVESIPLVEEWIEGYCNDSFDDNYPKGYELIAIKMIEFNMNKAGVTSESLSRHSMTMESDYPKSITRGLKRRLSW